MKANDYITRHEAIRALQINSSDYYGARRALCEIPAADVAPVVHGHFVHDGPRFAGGVDWWHCSSCGRLVSGVETRFDYCPNCGARMDGKDGGEIG